MLWTLIVLLLIAWSLAMSFKVGGMAAQLLLVAACIMMIVSFATARRPTH